MKRLSIGLAFAVCFLPALAGGPPVERASLIGHWEVVGIGGPTGLSRPDRSVFTFNEDGTIESLAWEDGEPAPYKGVGRFSLEGDVLKLDFEGSKAPHETYRVRWDGRYLLMQPVEPDGKDWPALFLEQRKSI